MVCAALLVPQLEVRPVPAVVGQSVEVVVAGLRQLEVTVTLPDGQIKPLGKTDEHGLLRFVPATIGEHVFVATIGGVRTLAPFAVVYPSRLVGWSVATVPLALWLLWREFSARARGRRTT